MPWSTDAPIVFAGEEMRPFLFGEPGRQLFGCLHSPAGRAARETGIVICPPLGHEYTRSHRVFRVAAQRLARAGFHVLRFDLAGCGDSAGDADDARVPRWLDDTRRAVDEVTQRCREVVILGRRLGATLGLLAGAECAPVSGVVLWDPVTRGSQYLAELRSSHSHFVTGYHGTVSVALEDPDAPPAEDSIEGMELLGQRMTAALLGDIEAIDLLTLNDAALTRALLIDSASTPSQGELYTHLSGLGIEAQLKHLPDPDAWQLDDLLKQVVSNPILGTITTWLQGAS